MIKLSHRYIDHIIKCLKQEVDQESINKTIIQLEELSIKRKSSIKTTENNSKLIKRENYE